MKKIALTLLTLFSLSLGASCFAQSYNLGTLRGYNSEKKVTLKTLRGYQMPKIQNFSGTGISGMD